MVLKHSLTLVRKSDDDTIFRAAAADSGKLLLIKSHASYLKLYLQILKLSVYKTIESKSKLPVAYRARQCDMFSVPESTSFTWRMSVKTSPKKPRFIIVGVQTAKR